MANVKMILIEGIVPFNIGETTNGLKLLGQLNRPASGERITYTETSSMPNSEIAKIRKEVPADGHGSPSGRTAMYFFTIRGVSSASYSWVEWVKNVIRDNGGTITKDSTYELE